VRLTTALAAIHRHPRHIVLFSLTTGLLLGPLSEAATLAAAVAAATLTIVAATTVAQHPLAAQATPTADQRTAMRSRVTPTSDDRGVVSGVGEAASSVALIVALVAAGAVLVGAVVADLRLAAIDGGRLASIQGRAIAARAVLLEPVRERSWGPAVARARLLGGPAPGEMAVLRVQPAVHPGAWPGVGEVVDVTGKVAPLGPYDAYQRRRGAGAALDVARLRATGERRGGISGIVDAARRRAEGGLTQRLDPPKSALLRGMVLGQDEQLTDATRDDFERSGLAHILAVSGQNVMLLATLVLAVGVVTGTGLRARLMLALLLVALYVPLTGAGPSIQRAGVMGAAGLVAALAGRPAHRWYALGLATAVTLALNPHAAGEPGWQLSFAAVVALLAIAPGLRGALARALPGPVADVAAITVAATVGTAPLMALHFQQVSLAALPANLLAAAAIAPVMWLGMLAAAAAQIAPALAAPFNAANAPLLGFIEWVARTMAAAPASVLPVRLSSPAALALAYAALGAAILVLRAACRAIAATRGPSRGRDSASIGTSGPRGSPRRAAVRGVALATAGGAALLLAVAPSTGGGTLPARGELVVSFLDVGQGDATLLQLRGVAVLVDTGPADGPIVQRLREAGVRRLDALVLTHAQTDHEGAALPVMRAYPPRLVVNGGAGWPTAVQRALPAALKAAASRRLDAHAGQILRTGGISMRMLWPPPPGPGFRPEGDPNHRALVAHVEFGDFDLLLPADAESDVTAALDLPQVEALKVAHHGSADEGLPAMLERIDPDVAAIEVGRENPYGHPAPSTLAALRAVPHVFRTDRDGTIRLRVRDGRIRFEPP
jgi:competence protein ComEC